MKRGEIWTLRDRQYGSNETYLYFLWIFSGKPLLPEVKMVK